MFWWVPALATEEGSGPEQHKPGIAAACAGAAWSCVRIPLSQAIRAYCAVVQRTRCMDAAACSHGRHACCSAMDAYCPPPARHSARTAGQPAKSWPPSCSRPTPKQPQADGALQLHPLEILPGCHLRHTGQRINRISAQPRGARQLGKHWTECHPRHAKATRPGLEASVPGGHTITDKRARERGREGYKGAVWSGSTVAL